MSQLFTIRTMLKAKMMLLMCVFMMYFLTPFDLVPESFFGIITIVDDMLVVFILLFAMTNMFHDLQIDEYP